MNKKLLIIKVYLFHLVIAYVTSEKLYKSVNRFNTTLKGFEDFLYDSIGDGEMANSFLSYDQYVKKLVQLRDDYPNLISLETIGTTPNNNNITAIKIKSKYHTNKAILFTGMHHAREPTSMMMNMNIIHKVIFLSNLNDASVQDLLNSVNIYLIPIINVDGYIVNVENFFKFNGDYTKCMVRKNRQTEPQDIFNKCSVKENFREVTVGVDLNRNYDYMFGYDNEGSSGIYCQEDFRGTHAFSEPETQAVKNFIESHPEIKIAFNYHAWGNLVIYPFNYADSKESTIKLFTNYIFFKHLYNEFVEEADFPKNFKHGNGMEAIQYKANGEASDWMLGEKRILAFSPELGIDNGNSNHFYPDRSTLLKVIHANLKSALYAVSRAAFYFEFKYLKNMFSDCVFVKSMSHKFLTKTEDELLEEQLCDDKFFIFSSKVELKNKGFTDYKGDNEFVISIDSQLLEYISIKINNGYKTSLAEKSRYYPGDNVIFEKNYNRSGQNSTYENKLTNLDLLNDSRVDGINFKVAFVESFNHVLIDIKFYISKESFAEFGKFLFENNKSDGYLLYQIKRRVDSLSTSTVHEGNSNYLLRTYDLKYISPEINIKLKDFEYFSVNNSTDTSNTNRYVAELRNLYTFLIIAVVIGLLILILIFLFKLRRDSTNSTGQEVIEEVIDEGISNPSVINSANEPKSKNNYVELHNIG